MKEGSRLFIHLRPVTRVMLTLALAAGLALALPSAAFADADDNISGAVPLTAVVSGTLDEESDIGDVFYVDLTAGQTFYASVTGPAGTDFDLFLYPPGSTDVYSDDPCWGAIEESYPDDFAYEVGASGRYYLVVAAVSGSGSYTVVWSDKLMPVHRFYNVENGSHFYTASFQERDIVIDRWSDVYDYEGVAYVINTGNPENNDLLYRFYNAHNGTHFYTASLEEKNYVIARWPDIYTYEGSVYNVCTNGSASGAVPMYRFYNRVAGSHFYTTSAQERDTVLTRWSNVYILDGIAYFLAP
ncbi:MAG: hypothetical protein AB2L09_03945 [Coriobacteriia bacterium]